MKALRIQTKSDVLFLLLWAIQTVGSFFFAHGSLRASVAGICILSVTAFAYFTFRNSKGVLKPLAGFAVLLVLQWICFEAAWRGHLHVNRPAAFFWGAFPYLSIGTCLLVRTVEGLLVFLSTVFALVLCGSWLWWTRPVPPAPLSYQIEPGKDCDYRDAADVGYELCPSTVRVKTCATQQDVPVYRATITSDAYSRRVIPFKPAHPSKTKLLAFGCSRTFGDGVSDADTYPNALAQALGVDASMYALSGWSPSQFIGRLQRPDFWTGQGDGRVVVVYLGIISHILRSTGAYYETVRYSENYPKYLIHDGQAERIGTLGDTSFWKFLVFPLLNQFHAYEHPIFQRLGASTRDYLAHLQWIRLEIQKHSADSLFYVVLHPGRYGTELRAQVPDSVFEELGYKVIDATQAFALEAPYIHHTQDDHLSAEGNRKLGAFIADAIAPAFSK